MEVTICFSMERTMSCGFLAFDTKIEDKNEGGTTKSGRVGDDGRGCGAADGDFPIALHAACRSACTAVGLSKQGRARAATQICDPSLGE
jgi:hypothetical protein